MYLISLHVLVVQLYNERWCGSPPFRLSCARCVVCLMRLCYMNRRSLLWESGELWDASPPDPSAFPEMESSKCSPASQISGDFVCSHETRPREGDMQRKYVKGNTQRIASTSPLLSERLAHASREGGAMRPSRVQSRRTCAERIRVA